MTPFNFTGNKISPDAPRASAREPEDRTQLMSIVQTRVDRMRTREVAILVDNLFSEMLDTLSEKLDTLYGIPDIPTERYYELYNDICDVTEDFIIEKDAMDTDDDEEDEDEDEDFDLDYSYVDELY